MLQLCILEGVVTLFPLDAQVKTIANSDRVG